MNAPYIFLATNDNNVNRNGDEVDVAPTVYYGLGLWNQTTFTPALDGFPMQLSLPDAEVQHRQAVLADTSNLPAPSISIADTGLRPENSNLQRPRQQFSGGLTFHQQHFENRFIPHLEQDRANHGFRHIRH